MLSFLILSTLLVKNDLSTELFANYSKDTRPVNFINETVNMKMGITINSLEYFDQKAEKLKLNMELHMDWYDKFLMWNESESESMIIPNYKIWLPDLELYNAAADPEEYESINSVVAYPNGHIFYDKPILYSFSCMLDLKEFPYDTQQCEMTFGSWKFDGPSLDIRLIDNPVQLSKDFSHNEWKVIDLNYEHQDMKYLCCPNTYWSINTFSIKFKRNSHKYKIIINHAIFIALTAFTVSLIQPYNYRRAFVLVFVPLSVIWIQIDVADKIPIVAYSTKIEKILLLTFVTCIVLACESVALYCYLQNKKTENFKKKQSRKIRKKLDYDIAVSESEYIFSDQYLNKVRFVDKCNTLLNFIIYLMCMLIL